MTAARPATVRDNPSCNRFELQTAAGLANANYRRDDRSLTITHTEVTRAVDGQGIGSKLVRGMLDQIRQEGRQVVPRCSFVASYISRHPEYRDLL